MVDKTSCCAAAIVIPVADFDIPLQELLSRVMARNDVCDAATLRAPANHRRCSTFAQSR
ncbi:hypothetical protein PSAB6_50204 [Paraburkholderia sabiae]|nr:hypothetical protein PSAB6_50204 [Paraburkholderia sabiae]